MRLKSLNASLVTHLFAKTVVLNVFVTELTNKHEKPVATSVGHLSVAVCECPRKACRLNGMALCLCPVANQRIQKAQRLLSQNQTCETVAL